ncbi:MULTISPECIES: methyltransferase domain-containing protein [Bacteroidaceae]|jgi:protein-L-isoaspartate(D-aspartate) O-methyltransferase|uniref:Methyltransferase domain-containing protein n=1 Tax=Phocaeicola massiliensis B84634 = Timone 84634 = DSM 17679 = JCM 13223 TaxID=1121098 RepID=U6RFC0_9BACT|nr:hypothetical protein [Phocaeicola massiliensis]EOA55205.1 hypothetical protein HMPREF1534_01614 [Phocaeicola massiliensis B84634 = Timone 84634 = DSM 17679 = JCM 13223]MDQ7677532.1 hypothetical protein [Phocaeicola massiliensis]
MEQLHNMLVSYNSRYIPANYRRSWSNQFCEQKFPLYWEKVFLELKKFDRNSKIIEVGCGQGDVTSIMCYLGFKYVRAYEMDEQMCEIAIKKIEYLFGRRDIIVCNKYPQKYENADILVLVNCAYADDCVTKNDYINKMLDFYIYAGKPKVFLLEVIDPEYDIPDDNFPYCIRLTENDIRDMFPQASIHWYQTYRYPINKRTKKLYVIQH